MKKFILLLASALLLLSSCSVGTYPITTGRADECGLSFVSKNVMAIDVTIDGLLYEMTTIKDKKYVKNGIKPTNKNTVILRPGSHEIKVKLGDYVLLSREVTVDAAEHRVIQL